MTTSQGSNQRALALTIDGMHCGNCIAKVARALTAVPGVEVDSLGIGSAKVRVDTEASSVEEVLSAVGKAGYPAKVAGE